MTARSHNRGNAIWFDELAQLWKYSDDDSLVRDGWQGRPCGKCGEITTKQGHDPCIADLPEVRNACCGHGNDCEAYIQFENGGSIAGKEARKIQKELVKQRN